MSFKREGDDRSQLNILKKRRVAELLSNFIPEDEASLMKNGRYTCLVCSYRPVFDTVDMLTVHRKGKRHLEGLKSFYGKKAQLKNEITKRQHENYVRAEDTRQEPSSSAPLLAQTRKLTHHALLKTVPYNSCHRKTSTKSEKGPQRVVSGCGDNTFNTTTSEQDRANQKSDASESLSGGTSSGCTAVNKELQPSGGAEAAPAAAMQEAEPLSAQRRRELEHYLKLKRAGYKTAAATGLKMRVWSSIQTRKSRLLFLRFLKVTERTKNCGRTQMNSYNSDTFGSRSAV